MSLLDDASLIITPNGRKSGKIYALKPFDGSGDLTVVRATTATYVGSDGLIKTALANEVRFDYTNGSCPSILVEPQRTNLALRSEEFDNVSWTKVNSTIIANSETSPMGTMNASKLVETISNSFHRIESALITAITGNIYSSSFYCKANERDWCVISYEGLERAYFNLSTGQIGSTNLIISANIFQLDNGWYRCSITYTATDTTSRAYIGIAIDNDNASYTGDGTSGIYIWGAQLEAGANATSYIPTVASAVTRNADVISKTGISDLIGQTQGTMFVECNFKNIDNLNRRILSVSDGTSTNRINIYFTGTKLGLLARNSSGIFVNIEKSVSDENVKICLKYNSTSYKFFVNGNVLNSSLFNIIPNLNVLQIGNFLNNEFLNDKINSAILWKTQLTDQQCISLTTL